MVSTGFGKLREKRKFQLHGDKDVVINFGKYKGKKFSQIAKVEPEYFQFLLDTQMDKISEELKKRLVLWADKSLSFWI